MQPNNTIERNLVMETIIHNFISNVTNFYTLSSFDFNSIVENTYEYSKIFVLDILKYLIETLDEEIRLSKSRKNKWYIERYDSRTILTPLGKLTFTRTYYKNKHVQKNILIFLMKLLVLINIKEWMFLLKLNYLNLLMNFHMKKQEKCLMKILIYQNKQLKTK